MRGLAIDLATAHQTRQRLGYPGGEFEQDECLARRQAERTARILGNAPQQPAKLPLALRAERTVLMPFAQYQLQNRPALDQVVEIGGIGRAGTLAIARLCAIQRGQDARRQPVQMLKEQRVDHRGNTVEIYVEEAAADPDPVGHLAQRDVECPAFADQRLRCVEQLLLAITLCRHGFHAPAVPRTHEIGKVATPTLPRFITIGLTVRSRLVTLNTKRGRTGMSEGIRRGMTRRGLIKAGSAAGALAVTAPALAARQATAAAVAEASEWREITPALTGYIAGARGHRIPAAIRERARLHILDTLAAIVACRPLEAAKLGRSYAAAMSPHGESPILASRQTASSVDAVFASAMTAHAAEINDFIPSAYVQPGPAIVPVALEAARLNGRTGTDLVGAVTAGYEIAGRLPKAIGTRNLYLAGLANHGVAPTFGAAAAAAPLMGLSAEQVDHMLAYCAQQASGSWQWLLDVRHVEKAFVFGGMGARNGMQAAQMAKLGFTGVPASFDNENAWFRWRAFQGEGADHASLVEGLHEHYELSLSAMKRYPVGGPTQPAVRALLDLRKSVMPGEVESISVAMPGEAATFERANMPALNIPYLAAIIMLDGRLDFVSAQSLERQESDTTAQAFARKVTVVRDEAQETGEGEDRTESARVTLVRKDGTREERYVAYVPGFPTHPLSKAEVEVKAHELVEPVLGTSQADRLVALCDGLDSAESVEPIIELMRFESA